MFLASTMAVLPMLQRSAEAAPSRAIPAAVTLARTAPAPQQPPPAQYPPPPPSGAWNQPPGSAPYGYGSQGGSGDFAAATARGTQDAEADSSTALWFFAGCGLGVVGILIAYIVEPTPPVARIMGKSPDYVMAYSNAYKSAGKSNQAKHALYGCLVGTAVFVAVYLIAVATVLHEASTMTTY
jgi:hypothetical protein